MQQEHELELHFEYLVIMLVAYKLNNVKKVTTREYNFCVWYMAAVLKRWHTVTLSMVGTVLFAIIIHRHLTHFTQIKSTGR